MADLAFAKAMQRLSVGPWRLEFRCVVGEGTGKTQADWRETVRYVEYWLDSSSGRFIFNSHEYVTCH
jgi:hypothetical protein